ncbi:uncharacterized protein LOC109856297 [Pseudomyrmex gracilis]|uniref:uncharacterized protein LOC109856297 n=1 Tax=Pseudomyrmex gracilis TaxID=219809 RepID=UPI000995D6FF|nr:uncharacterized protein LOC109856297 [Pseudomyrmex gracilis]
MSGFRMWALQDLSHIFKLLRRETRASLKVSKRQFSSLLDSSCKHKNARNSGKIHLPAIPNDLGKSISVIRLTISENVRLSAQSPVYFKHNDFLSRLQSPHLGRPFLARLQSCKSGKSNKWEDRFKSQHPEPSGCKSRRSKPVCKVASKTRCKKTCEKKKRTCEKKERTCETLRSGWYDRKWEQRNRESACERKVCPERKKKTCSDVKSAKNCDELREVCEHPLRRRNNFRCDKNNRHNSDKCRYYSRLSISSVPPNCRLFPILTSGAIREFDTSETTRRFYVSCSDDKKKKKNETTKSRNCKRTRKVCRTSQKSKVEKPDKPTSCYEMYCANRKAANAVEDRPKKESMKEQIEREFREIKDCKKSLKKDRNDDKQKTIDRKFASVPNKLISYILTSVMNIPLIQSEINKRFQNIVWLYPHRIRDVSLFNAMFGRSFSTMKVDDQNDSAVKRAVDRDKIDQNYLENNNDLIQGDELPNYIEAEDVEEENDV